jgi:hypothetical protein
VGVTWETYQQQQPTRKGDPDMIVVEDRDRGGVYLVGTERAVYIGDPESLAQIQAALTDPGHIARVDASTVDSLKG